MYLNGAEGCLKLVFTYATLSNCLKHIAALNTFLFACLCSRKKINLSKTARLLKANCRF